jgi:TonB family protein
LAAFKRGVTLLPGITRPDGRPEMNSESRVLVLGALFAISCATTPPKAVDVPAPPSHAPVAELLEQLSSADPAVRASAAWALADATEAADVRAALQKAAEDPSRAVRYGAQWALGRARLSEAAPVTLGPDYTVARAVHVVKPEYPREAFNKKITGTVILEVLIGEEGEVAHAEVRQSVAGLDAAAFDCVKQWRFTPALRAGNPIATVVRAPVGFGIF